MAKKVWSFGSLVAAVSATLVLGVSGILGSAVWLRSSDMLADQAGRSLAELSHQLADKLDRDMAMRVGEVQVLAGLLPKPDLQSNSAGTGALRSRLEIFGDAFPATSWLGLLDRNGVVVAATQGILEGSSAAARPVFTEGSKGLFVGDVHDAVLLAKLLSNPSGEPLRFVDIAVPIKGSDAELSGVLAAHFSWEWAREIERSVLTPGRGHASVEMFVIGTENDVLLGPPALTGRKLELDALVRGRSGPASWTVEVWPDGRNYLTGYAAADGHGKFQGLGWTVLARQPVEVAHAPANELLHRILIVGGVLALMFSAIGWAIALWTTNSLVAIADAADRIRRGDLATRFPESSAIREVRSLSFSLKALVDALTRKDHALERMEDLAHLCPVTALPNRHHFEKVAAGLTLADAPCALLYIDLDRFKPVNDRFGHHAGDAMLRIVASRLASCLRGRDFLARVGGDEFVALIFGSRDIRATAEDVGHRIIAAISEPAVIEGEIVRIGCSIGIALWPDEGADLKICMEAADAAMYRAKKTGTGLAAGWHADAAVEAGGRGAE